MADIDLLQAGAVHEQVPLDTPFFRAYRGVYREARVVAPHFHDEVEILLPEGLAGETWVDGQRFYFERRSVHVIRPGAVHGFRVRPQGDGSIYVAQLNPERCAKWLKGFPGFDADHFHKRLLRLPVAMDALRPDLLSALLGLSPFLGEKAPAVESALSDLELIGRMLRLLLEGARGAPEKIITDDRLRRTLDAVEKDLDKPFDLDRLSKTVALSKSHLCRVFRKSTGMTLTEYLAHARAHRAARLISERGMNVTEAAFECGFESVSYFIKVFKKTLGKTPKQWALELKE